MKSVQTWLILALLAASSDRFGYATGREADGPAAGEKPALPAEKPLPAPPIRRPPVPFGKMTDEQVRGWRKALHADHAMYCSLTQAFCKASIAAGATPPDQTQTEIALLNVSMRLDPVPTEVKGWLEGCLGKPLVLAKLGQADFLSLGNLSLRMSLELIDLSGEAGNEHLRRIFPDTQKQPE